MQTLRIIALYIAVALIIPVTAVTQEPGSPPDNDIELTPFIPGTDKPRTQQCGRDTVYRYNEYTIYTKPTADVAGEDIDVYKTDPKNSDFCKIKDQKPVHTFDNEIMGGANFFAGLYLDYLFIDQGTGPSLRGLSIYDLSDGKLQFFTNYSDPVISNGALTYYETISSREFFDNKATCNKRGHWLRSGLRVLFQKQISYDLETGKKESLEKFRCVPAQ